MIPKWDDVPKLVHMYWPGGFCLEGRVHVCYYVCEELKAAKERNDLYTLEP